MGKKLFAALVAVSLLFGGIVAEAKPRPKSKRAKAGAARLYDKDGLPTKLLTWRILKGSTEAKKTEREIMTASKIADIADFTALEAAVNAGTLVQLQETTGYGFSKTIGEKALTPVQKPKYQYTTPQVVRLMDDVFGDIAAKFTKQFAEMDPTDKKAFPTPKMRKDMAMIKGWVIRFSVDSLVRDVAYQQRLRKTNGNALETGSSHPGGSTVDVLLQTAEDKPKGLPWLVLVAVRQRLTQLEMTDVDGNPITKDTPPEKRLIQATEEHRRGKPSCWHVMVSPAYLTYSDRERKKVANASSPAKSEPASAAPAAAVAVPTPPSAPPAK